MILSKMAFALALILIGVTVIWISRRLFSAISHREITEAHIVAPIFIIGMLITYVSIGCDAYEWYPTSIYLEYADSIFAWLFLIFISSACIGSVWGLCIKRKRKQQ